MNFKVAFPKILCVSGLLYLGMASCGGAAQSKPDAAVGEFVAADPREGGEVTSIVVQSPGGHNLEADWEALKTSLTKPPGNVTVQGVNYLREGILKMTGREIPVVAGPDISRGIVLTTLANAPAEVRNDPAVRDALRNTGKDPYNANEAYFIRTEPERVLIVVNTPVAIDNAVVALLESVEYEVLGMGPDWVHVPDYHHRPLVFSHQEAGRPGFYIRVLWATSGQDRGVGTLAKARDFSFSDPADEDVGTSYQRWQIGTRMATVSMPPFLGHAMQASHNDVLNQMRKQGSTDGFLVEKASIGPEATRPAASEANKGELWLNEEMNGKVFISSGSEWKEQNLHEIRAALDLSIPFVRQVILDKMKLQIEKHFAENPEATITLGTDPEDGSGYARLGTLMKNKHWYPDYLAKEGVPFGQPYLLDGFRGLKQPIEIWDPNAASDTVFGFDNWLLRELDKWIDSLPPEQRVTAAGTAKRDLLRCSNLSYNYYDVPPNFNLDPRIGVGIATFPKHRGQGKWINFQSQLEMAGAFNILLPREPAGIYRLFSLARYSDRDLSSIKGSPSAKAVQKTIKQYYDAGILSLRGEADFNYGRYGLWYYLMTKALWNPNLSGEELDAVRDRWFQRAFGSAWREMKTYYDFMSWENYTFNAPNVWAKATRLLDAASRKIDGDKEPEAQRRIDDVKQYWYFFYLVDSGQTKPPSEALREFAWKGQMSYMTSMVMVTKEFFEAPGKKLGVNAAIQIAGPNLSKGPAHYTHEETDAWWSKVLEFWPLTPVAEFQDAVLADGTKGSQVDLFDLVSVRAFQEGAPADNGFLYNASSGREQMSFLTTAYEPGEEVGFQLFWGWNPKNTHTTDKKVPYGISYWDTKSKTWDELVDITTASEVSTLRKSPDGTDYQWVEVRYPAPQAGTYRVDVGFGGDTSHLTTLDYDFDQGVSPGVNAQTYYSSVTSGHTQSDVWFYIPKGTKSLDLEFSEKKNRSLCFHRGLPNSRMTPTRVVDVSAKGTHKIPLKPNEDGSLVSMKSAGFQFPYLYSVPILWAKTPAALLLPRAIAKADRLSITSSPGSRKAGKGRK